MILYCVCIWLTAADVYANRDVLLGASWVHLPPEKLKLSQPQENGGPAILA